MMIALLDSVGVRNSKGKCITEMSHHVELLCISKRLRLLEFGVCVCELSEQM